MKTLPLVTIIEVQATAPSLHDNTADLDRLKNGVRALLSRPLSERNLCIPYKCMGRVAAAFRAGGFRGYAVLSILPWQLDIIDFLPEKTDYLPALALDLGTTHLEATLVDLLTGKTLAHGHIVNRQIEFGTDILSRIHFAERGGDGSGLELLQRAIVESINELAGELVSQVDIPVQEVYALAVSGNTTMVHLLLGINPYHICREPYIPLVNDPDPVLSSEIGLELHPQALAWVLPSIGSYFGGDLISGILASGLDQAEHTSMLIDVGTNAEVVLGNREWLIACAGAAGPALEGGVAKMGMRAGAGAVEHVKIDHDSWQLKVQTIDNVPAVGICGSGLIDLVAELYLARIVDLRGKFQDEFTGQSPEQRAFVREHLVDLDGEKAFIVIPLEESGTDAPVLLTQIDLDAMMRSKAAMYAILTTLTGQVGVEFGELERIYVAGAFGRHIDPRQAITLGMLPDLELETYKGIGNSSLHGAEQILFDEEARLRARDIGQKITYIELNVNQDFMIRFSGSRFIPHTDPKVFPSVPVFS
ncbi:MAG: [Fe-S]-binding protein [Desulfobulbus sp.]|nr:MAG: [Fe-S]-binding protein [Desulfobulbus sp.]